MLEWQVAKKLMPYLLIAAAIGYVLLLRHDLGNARDKLSNEISWRQSIAVALQCPKDGPATVRQCLDARLKESANRKETLDRISQEAWEEGKRSRAADADLDRAQQENTRKFAAAQRQIEELQKRQPSGNPDKDCATMAEDTQAAWKGWK